MPTPVRRRLSHASLLATVAMAIALALPAAPAFAQFDVTPLGCGARVDPETWSRCSGG